MTTKKNDDIFLSMEIKNDNIYKSIKVICAAAGMSEADLARAVGDTPQAFSNKMRRGKIQSDIEYLQKVAEAVGFDFEYSFVEK